MGRPRIHPLPSAEHQTKTALRRLASTGSTLVALLCRQIVEQLKNLGLRAAEGNLAAVAFLKQRIVLSSRCLSAALSA